MNHHSMLNSSQISNLKLQPKLTDKYCCLYLCKYNKEFPPSDIDLYPLPNSLHERVIWCRVFDIPAHISKDSKARVCGLHFKKKYFLKDAQPQKNPDDNQKRTHEYRSLEQPNPDSIQISNFSQEELKSIKNNTSTLYFTLLSSGDKLFTLHPRAVATPQNKMESSPPADISETELDVEKEVDLVEEESNVPLSLDCEEETLSSVQLSAYTADLTSASIAETLSKLSDSPICILPDSDTKSKASDQNLTVTSQHKLSPFQKMTDKIPKTTPVSMQAVPQMLIKNIAHGATPIRLPNSGSQANPVSINVPRLQNAQANFCLTRPPSKTQTFIVFDPKMSSKMPSNVGPAIFFNNQVMPVSTTSSNSAPVYVNSTQANSNISYSLMNTNVTSAPTTLYPQYPKHTYSNSATTTANDDKNRLPLQRSTQTYSNRDTTIVNANKSTPPAPFPKLLYQSRFNTSTYRSKIAPKTPAAKLNNPVPMSGDANIQTKCAPAERCVTMSSTVATNSAFLVKTTRAMLSQQITRPTFSTPNAPAALRHVMVDSTSLFNALSFNEKRGVPYQLLTRSILRPKAVDVSTTPPVTLPVNTSQASSTSVATFSSSGNPYITNVISIRKDDKGQSLVQPQANVSTITSLDLKPILTNPTAPSNQSAIPVLLEKVDPLAADESAVEEIFPLVPKSDTSKACFANVESVYETSSPDSTLSADSETTVSAASHSSGTLHVKPSFEKLVLVIDDDGCGWLTKDNTNKAPEIVSSASILQSAITSNNTAEDTFNPQITNVVSLKKNTPQVMKFPQVEKEVVQISKGIPPIFKMQKTIPVINGNPSASQLGSAAKYFTFKLPSPKNNQYDAMRLRHRLRKELFTTCSAWWLVERNLMPMIPPCSLCAQNTFELNRSSQFFDSYCWTCQNPLCRTQEPIKRPKFFEKFKFLTMEELLLLTYHWACQSSLCDMQLDVNIDSDKIRSYFKELQELCKKECYKLDFGIGDTVIEASIVKLGKHFVLGAYDRSTQLVRLELIKEIDALETDLHLQILNKWLKTEKLVKKRVLVTECVLHQSSLPRDVLKVAANHKAKHTKDATSCVYHIQNIQNYLTKNLGNIFKEANVLSLDFDVVQGILSELQWRDKLGKFADMAFWRILEHIKAQNEEDFESISTNYVAGTINVEKYISEMKPTLAKRWAPSDPSSVITNKFVKGNSSANMHCYETLDDSDNSLNDPDYSKDDEDDSDSSNDDPDSIPSSVAEPNLKDDIKSSVKPSYRLFDHPLYEQFPVLKIKQSLQGVKTYSKNAEGYKQADEKVLPGKYKSSVMQTARIQEKSVFFELSTHLIGLFQDVPPIIGGDMPVEPKNLLSIKIFFGDTKRYSLIYRSEAYNLGQRLREEEFICESVRWMVRRKYIKSESPCYVCYKRSFLKTNSKFSDGCSWMCQNPLCRFENVFKRPCFFQNFQSVSISHLCACIFHWTVQSDAANITPDAPLDFTKMLSIWKSFQVLCGNALKRGDYKLGSGMKIVELALVQYGKLYILGALERITNMVRLKVFTAETKNQIFEFCNFLGSSIHPNAFLVINCVDIPSAMQINSLNILLSDTSITDPFDRGPHVLNVTHFMMWHLSSMFKHLAADEVRPDLMQGYLDELMWRQAFGSMPKVAFANIMDEIFYDDKKNSAKTKNATEKCHPSQVKVSLHRLSEEILKYYCSETNVGSSKQHLNENVQPEIKKDAFQLSKDNVQSPNQLPGEISVLQTCAPVSKTAVVLSSKLNTYSDDDDDIIILDDSPKQEQNPMKSESIPSSQVAPSLVASDDDDDDIVIVDTIASQKKSNTNKLSIVIKTESNKYNTNVPAGASALNSSVSNVNKEVVVIDSTPDDNSVRQKISITIRTEPGEKYTCIQTHEQSQVGKVPRKRSFSEKDQSPIIPSNISTDLDEQPSTSAIKSKLCSASSAKDVSSHEVPAKKEKRSKKKRRLFSKKKKVSPAEKITRATAAAKEQPEDTSTALRTECIECGETTTMDHFMKEFSCNDCKTSVYRTCCSKSFFEHRGALLFGKRMPRQDKKTFGIHKPIYLHDPWFCLCGFCTISGNKLASHLVKCEKRTCYGYNPDAS